MMNCECMKDCYYRVGTDCKALVWECCSERMECIEEKQRDEEER